MEICWAVDCVGGPLLACDTEAEAIESQQIAEYESGMIAIVYRSEPPLSEATRSSFGMKEYRSILS